MQMSLIFGGFLLSEVEDVSVSSRRAPGTAGPGGEAHVSISVPEE